MRFIILNLVAGCMLILNTLALAQESNTCLASNQNQKNKDARSFFSIQNPLFANDFKYRQWVDQCGLSKEKFERIRRSYFVIDVRAPDSYAKNHIPESVNMTLSSIKTKLFLKNKNILLVGEAYDRVLMTDACKKLRNSGYPKVKVLEGGIASELKNRFTLSPSKLIYENRYDPWIVIDLSMTGSGKLNRYFETLSRLNAYPTLDQFREIVESITNSSSLRSPTPIIVIDKNGKEYKRFEKWRAELAGKFIGGEKYYLNGGVKGFNEYVKKQQIILSKQEFVLTRPRGCAR